MSVEQRIQMCRLLEKMYGNKEYSRKLGLENNSTFHGKGIYHENKMGKEDNR